MNEISHSWIVTQVRKEAERARPGLDLYRVRVRSVDGLAPLGKHEQFAFMFLARGGEGPRRARAAVALGAATPSELFARLRTSGER